MKSSNMQAFSKSYVLLYIGLLSLTVHGCSSPLKWVNEENSPSPSCVPDRLPVWEDFSRKTWEQYLQEDRPRSVGSQISLQYLVNAAPPFLIVKINRSESWISPEFTNPVNSIPPHELNQGLVHAQIHYMIHCMLIREGNKELESGGNPHEMLDLVRTIAQRKSVQYDQDTENGLNEELEARWKLAVRQQFEDRTQHGIQKIIALQNMRP